LKNIILKGESYTFDIHNSIVDIKESWNQLVGDQIYAQSDYNLLLESNGPLGFRYYYVIVSKGGTPIATYYFQSKQIHLSKDFRIHSHDDKFITKLKVWALKRFFKLVKHQMLICGNVLLTGEYAFNETSKQSVSQILTDAVIDAVKDFIYANEKKKIQSVLFKDFYVEDNWSRIKFEAKGFTEVTVQPDMIVNINEEWTSYQDYLSAVKSKYRVKFKKVKKKGEALDFRQLDIEDAQKYNEQMYSLYKSTSEKALFSLFLLDPQYFARLKKTLGDHMILYGVFLNDKVVGFFTFVENGLMADAHFLGYDVKLNSKYQIYFNMLLKLIEAGIEKKSSHLNLSRTALEIKSSVGAEPHEMKVYLRHENKLINKTAKFILDKTVPKNDWLPRSPFK